MNETKASVTMTANHCDHGHEMHAVTLPKIAVAVVKSWLTTALVHVLAFAN